VSRAYLEQVEEGPILQPPKTPTGCLRFIEAKCQESELDKLERGIEVTFAVFPEVPVFFELCETAFDDPTLGHEREDMPFVSFGNLHANLLAENNFHLLGQRLFSVDTVTQHALLLSQLGLGIAPRPARSLCGQSHWRCSLASACGKPCASTAASFLRNCTKCEMHVCRQISGTRLNPPHRNRQQLQISIGAAPPSLYTITTNNFLPLPLPLRWVGFEPTTDGLENL